MEEEREDEDEDIIRACLTSWINAQEYFPNPKGFISHFQLQKSSRASPALVSVAKSPPSSA